MLGLAEMDGKAAQDHGKACLCCQKVQPATQSLEEIEFLKSACAAAQSGKTGKVRSLIARNPEALHSDGRAGR